MVLLIVQKFHRAHFPLIYGNIEKIVIIVILRESAHIRESAHPLKIVISTFYSSLNQFRKSAHPLTTEFCQHKRPDYDCRFL